MRRMGFTLAVLFIAGIPASAQQPIPPGAPTAAPPAAPPVVNPAPPAGALDIHLAAWEKKMSNLINFRVELALTRKEAVFNKTKDYTGVMLCMKPSYAIMRLDYTGDRTKSDYEAYICNGKSLFVYSGIDRTITEHKLPAPATNSGGQTDNLMIDFLSGMKAADAKRRFELTIFKEDDYYVYLDIKPLMDKDKLDFQQARLALYGPKTKFAYLPAQMYIVRSNGDSEQWKLTNPQTDLPGIDHTVFQYKDVPGFTSRQAPPQPQGSAVRPGPMGAVRP